jgi:hypothetical protein
MSIDKPLPEQPLFITLLASCLMLASLSHAVKFGAWVDELTKTQKNVVVELNSGEKLKGELQRNWDGSYLLIPENGAVTPFRQFKYMAIPSDGQPKKFPLFTFIFPACFIAAYFHLLWWLWGNRKR